MKLAFIIPRYHVPQAGGAEILVENLARELVKKGHEIDVLTTRAQSHLQWKDEFPSGEEWINGVRVHRFSLDAQFHSNQFVRLQQRIERGWPLKPREEEIWMKGSVHSQELYQVLENEGKKWDAFIFAPYLFGITYEGLKVVPKKSFLIPCLHPEPYADLKIFKEMFQYPRGFLFNSYPEMKLAKRLFGISDNHCEIVGMGFSDSISMGNGTFRQKFGLGETPFLLYAGRRERGKNTPLLIHYFSTYEKRHPGSLLLVLLGSGTVEELSIKTNVIRDIGFVDRQEMLKAYREAWVSCQPSLNESFSIVLMESWLAGTPVMVNEKCEVTRDHVARSKGGLWFNNYFEFEEGLDFFLKNEHLRKEMGENGRKYVLDCFKWDNILNRFLGAIQKGLRK